MSTIGKHELLTIIGILLIVCAVALGNVRHNAEIKVNRQMLELHASAQDQDMAALKQRISRLNRQLQLSQERE